MSELVDFSVWCNNFTTLRRAVPGVQGEAARKTEQADWKSSSGCLVDRPWFWTIIFMMIDGPLLYFFFSSVYSLMVEESSNAEKLMQFLAYTKMTVQRFKFKSLNSEVRLIAMI